MADCDSVHPSAYDNILYPTDSKYRYQGYPDSAALNPPAGFNQYSLVAQDTSIFCPPQGGGDGLYFPATIQQPVPEYYPTASSSSNPSQYPLHLQVPQGMPQDNSWGTLGQLSYPDFAPSLAADAPVLPARESQYSGQSGPPHVHSGVPLEQWSMAGSLDPSTGVFYRTTEHPRLRTAQACEKCRARKAKCSGDHPSCQRCINRGLICEYAPERRMRGPNKPKNRDGSISSNSPPSSVSSRRSSVAGGATTEAACRGLQPHSCDSSPELQHRARLPSGTTTLLNRAVTEAREGDNNPRPQKRPRPPPLNLGMRSHILRRDGFISDKFVTDPDTSRDHQEDVLPTIQPSTDVTMASISFGTTGVCRRSEEVEVYRTPPGDEFLRHPSPTFSSRRRASSLNEDASQNAVPGMSSSFRHHSKAFSSSYHSRGVSMSNPLTPVHLHGLPSDVNAMDTMDHQRQAASAEVSFAGEGGGNHPMSDIRGFQGLGDIGPKLAWTDLPLIPPNPYPESNGREFELQYPMSM
ncbi:hypothetical protein JAAARDRAFT_62562 [Jaapia argillacea MUCL 33604]|uniref:Zn(2)-C6 fungal-type domain-containing protein n=1 Tax=Jaapia argillacea MUCL 33604 TaxID=933084 RepID=A0A067P8V2_9AGAM|nr:hypothetical protein JAAARDRAFT_62562 [Jaapia argillacea MUCL 33604]